MNTSPVARSVPALIAAGVLLATACTPAGPGQAADVDLGSGPPQAGTVKEGALKGATMTFVSYGGIFQDGQAKAAQTPGHRALPMVPPNTGQGNKPVPD